MQQRKLTRCTKHPVLNLNDFTGLMVIEYGLIERTGRFTLKRGSTIISSSMMIHGGLYYYENPMRDNPLILDVPVQIPLRDPQYWASRF